MPVGGFVAAGYPAEAYNYLEDRIDMNKYILGIKDQEKYKDTEGSEYYPGQHCGHIKCVWATHQAMTGQGIHQGDLIVIDTHKEPHKDSIVLFWLKDEFALKKCVIHPTHIELISLCGDIPPVCCKEEPLLRIGVVTHVIKKLPCSNNLYGGYPENVSGFIANGMDFNTYVIGDNYWETIFYLWAAGDSMIGDGIEKGDLLVVDKAREPYDDSIIVFYLDRQFTLKRIERTDHTVRLVSSNPHMKPIPLHAEHEVKKWGVLIAVIKKYN